MQRIRTGWLPCRAWGNRAYCTTKERFVTMSMRENELGMESVPNAFDRYNTIRKTGQYPPPSFYYSMIQLLIKEKQSNNVTMYLKELNTVHRDHVAPEEFFQNLFHFYQRLKRWKEGNEVYHQMREKHRHIQTSTYECAVTAIGNQSIKTVKAMFEELKEYNIPLSYTLCNNFCATAYSSKDFALLEEMFIYFTNHFQPTLFMHNLVISAFSWRPETYSKAKQYFASLRNSKLEPDVISFNNMVKIHCHQGEFSKAFEYLEEMQQKDIKLDKKTFISFLHETAKRGKFDITLKVVERAVASKTIDHKDIYEKVAMHAILAKRTDFLETLESKLDVSPDDIDMVSLCNQWIRELQKNREDKKAFALFQLMKLDKRFHPDIYTYTTMMNHYIEKRDGPMLKQLYAEVRSSGLEMNIPFYTMLVRHLSFSNNLMGIQKVVFDIHHRKLETDLNFYTSLLTAYGRLKQSRMCMAVYELIQKSDMQPNVYTLNSVLSSLERCGAVDQANSFFTSEYPRYNITPDVATHNIMVKLAMAENNMDGILKHFTKVQKLGATAVAYNVAISGALSCWDIDQAKIWYQQMKAKKYIPSPALKEMLNKVNIE